MSGLWQKVRNGFVRTLEILLMVLVAAMTLTVLWGVFTRFCLGRQAHYTDELARVLLVWISMIGSALAFGAKAHLGVDYFVSKLHPEARKTMSVVVQGVILALALIVFVVMLSVMLLRHLRRVQVVTLLLLQQRIGIQRLLDLLL